MGTPIYLLLGFDFVHHFGRYLLFIATLGEHALLYVDTTRRLRMLTCVRRRNPCAAVLAGIGATLGLLVGSLVKDVQSAQQVSVSYTHPSPRRGSRSSWMLT